MKISQAIENGIIDTVSIKTPQCEYDFLSDTMREKAKDLLADANIPEFFDIVENLRYSLGYSQGDGVAFHCGKTEWEYMREDTDETEYMQRRFVIVTNSYASHYSHEKTFCVECEFDGDETDDEREDGEKRAEELTEDLRDVCYKLKSFGYECIQEEDRYYMGKDTIREFLEENGIEWLYAEDIDFDTEKFGSNVKIGDCEWCEIFIADFDVSEKTRTTENKYFEATK